MSERARQGSSSAGKARFATTHWSVVLAAAQSSSPQHRQALSTLCQMYWRPLYAYLRRRGYDAHQAEDFTQGFFAEILEKHDLRAADPQCGRFRSFLLATLKHFLSDERDRARAQKRGGGRKPLSLDVQDAESHYAIEPADHLSPEKLFERSWALTVLDRTMTRLRTEYTRRNTPELFDHLKTYLTTDKDAIPYGQTAAAADMTEGAVRVAVHRLRRRYRQLLRDEIAETVAAPDQIDEEIAHLFEALAH